MSVVVVNAISVPPHRREEFERRFATRAGRVSGADGFEAFELLRTTGGSDRYLVYTRWRSQEDFEAWMRSAQFSASHREHGGDDAPVSSGSEVWSFEVIEREDAPTTG
jgi:heme-degrading monooxygenase HmoA